MYTASVIEVEKCRRRSRMGRRMESTLRPRRERMSKKARKVARDAIAHGIRPVKSLADLACGTPEDADELLEAIRELRRAEYNTKE